MKVEIKIDKSCTEPKITIVTNKITEEINQIAKKLTNEQSQILVGFKDEKVLVLDPNQIYRVYATNAKVYAETEFDTLLLKLRLYEIEERLDPNLFVRISNSEIINLKKVQRFDLSFTGTICVKLSNKTITYASRRYVSKIKQLLGI